MKELNELFFVLAAFAFGYVLCRGGYSSFDLANKPHVFVGRKALQDRQYVDRKVQR